MSVEKTLKERGKVYGNFMDQARIGQALKTVVYGTDPRDLAPDQLEAIEMICTKVARILNGNPNYLDNWIDIAGYATLVASRLAAEESK